LDATLPPGFFAAFSARSGIQLGNVISKPEMIDS